MTGSDERLGTRCVISATLQQLRRAQGPRGALPALHEHRAVVEGSMAPWVGVHVGVEASVSRGGCQRGEGGASFAGFNWRRLRARFGAASGEAYALSCRWGRERDASAV
jgi:hypothetical protein